MEKIIDGIFAMIFVFATVWGGAYSLKSMCEWSRNLAFDKIHQGMGSLEKSTRTMTGGKLDF